MYPFKGQNMTSSKQAFQVLRPIVEMTGIVVFSAVIAFMTNWLRGDGIAVWYRGFTTPQCGETLLNVPFISASEAIGLLNDPDTVIFDIRPSPDYETAHLKGALNLPHSLLKPYEKRDLEPFMNKRVVIYGSNRTDERAVSAASELLSSSLKRVMITEGGFTALQEAGAPISEPVPGSAEK